MKYFSFIIIALTLPLISFAAPTVQGIVNVSLNIIQGLAVIILGFAVIYFLYGLLKYVTAKDTSDRRDAISVITYGIFAIFIMIAIWGLVALLSDSIGIDTGDGIGKQEKSIRNLIK